MNDFKDFIVQNFILICVASVMITISIQRYKQHPTVSLYAILISSFAFLLAISAKLEQMAIKSLNPTGALIAGIGVYTLGPICVYLFGLLGGTVSTKSKWFFISYIPLIINPLIYLLGFIPGVRDYVVYYAVEGGACVLKGGPFRFTSHVIAFGYIAWIVYLSMSMLQNKRFTRGITVLGCAIFTVTVVIIESFFNQNGDIFLLGSTIVTCLLVYYLFLYIEKTQIDTSTGLYNRETYYIDIDKLKRDITGVIQFDMNGLKNINDSLGHSAGDEAIKKVAKCILNAANKKMFGYRVGGDEFVLLGIKCKKIEIVETIKRFNELIAKTDYRCAVGHAYKTRQDETVQEMIQEADQRMYINKSNFYINHPEYNRRTR